MTNVIFEESGPLTFSEEDSTVFPDYACGICSRELTYGGKGRKPTKCTPNNGGDPECYGINNARSSTGSSPRSSSKKVEAALAVMAGAYEQMIQILLFMSPAGAAALEERIPSQQMRNKMSFEASPALCDRVAGWGGKGGMWTFLLSNVAMMSVVGRIAYADVAAQKAMLESLLSASGSGMPDGFDLKSLFNIQ